MDFNRLPTPDGVAAHHYSHTLPGHDLPAIHQQLAEIEREFASVRRRHIHAILTGISGGTFVVATSLVLAWLTLHPHCDVLPRNPTVAMSRACNATRYPSHCLATLLTSPRAFEARTNRDLLQVSLDATLGKVHGVLSTAAGAAASLTEVEMDRGKAKAAHEDCLELLEDSKDLLQMSRSAFLELGTGRRSGGGVNGTGPMGSVTTNDLHTWLTAALTNHATCIDGIQEVPGCRMVKQLLLTPVEDIARQVSNCLAIFTMAVEKGEFAGETAKQDTRRQLVSMGAAETGVVNAVDGFPEWVRRRDRRLLQVPPGEITADFVVSQDGNGTHRNISQAVEDAPDKSNHRFVIYIKAGRYYEYTTVGKNKRNLFLVGDGINATIISGCRSVFDPNVTTYKSATFAATGSGFMARDITFENTAGPEKHQAVALRIGADLSVIYRCEITGYQDTLYVHSNRQFFRDCLVYGTVDFVFGNAAAVLQNCTFYARKPLLNQTNVVTAQGRSDPCSNSGISIHASRVLPAPDLVPVKSQFHTYLGRPWKLYSRAVLMKSYIDDHVDPAGWLEWNGTFALGTLTYGEYMNYGPGAAIGKRVHWTGYRRNLTAAEASKYTVEQFIDGIYWLPTYPVAFDPGLQ